MLRGSSTSPMTCSWFFLQMQRLGMPMLRLSGRPIRELGRDGSPLSRCAGSSELGNVWCLRAL